MPLVTFDEMRNLGTLAKGYLWEVIFSNVPTEVIAGVPNAPEVLRLRARRINIPTREFVALLDPFQGLEITDTGMPIYGHDLTMTFTETIDGWIGLMIEKWLDLSYNPLTGVAKKKPDRTAIMDCNLLNDEGVPFRSIRCYGCQPRNNTSGTELNYETKDAKVEYQTIFLMDFYQRIK